MSLHGGGDGAFPLASRSVDGENGEAMTSGGNGERCVERSAGGFAVFLYAVDPDLYAAELAGDGGGGLDDDR